MNSVITTWTVDNTRAFENFAGRANVVSAVQVSIKVEDLFGGTFTDIRIVSLDVFNLPDTLTDISELTEHQVLSWVLKQLGPVEVAAIEAKAAKEALNLTNGWNVKLTPPPWL